MKQTMQQYDWSYIPIYHGLKLQTHLASDFDVPNDTFTP